jgi:Brp/Blh family beta-carotene 15,15'-monooxygenase
MTTLLPRARRTSRLVVLGALASGSLLSRRAPGGRMEQAVVLGALALGMPHGAADTELLRSAAGGSRPRHLLLAAGYALLATGATVVVRQGGSTVERGVLLASAAHFGEGELACWGAAPPGRARRRAALRLLAAAVTTVALPAAVGTANSRPPEVGVTGALAEAPPRAAGERTGLSLLRNPATRRTVAPFAGVAGAAIGALAMSGDREAAADSSLLCALALLAPPSTSFAAYFGGWHALRHTARVVDALVADGALPPQQSLPRAVGELGRRSAWAAGVGLVGAGVLAAADREHASDNAFAAVLGLTVPHMSTVALELSRRGR